MRTYTNLAWPDDPYRASQQLYKRPSPVLAAFAVLPSGQPAGIVPAAVAVVYLPLHRTRALTVTERTLAFGFRAASITAAEEIGELARLADLDLMQARRHARFLAGHELPPALRMLREAAPALVTRGLEAVQAGWADRQARARGNAALVDVRDDCGDGTTTDLAGLSHAAGVEASAAGLTGRIVPRDAAKDDATAEHLAAAAAERALVIALTCAQHLDQYRWQGVLDTSTVMAAATWDLFPRVVWDHASCCQPAS